MALWGGRFTQAADQRFKQLNDSLRFDYRLAEQDIVGSVAWSKALVTVNVLTATEQQQLEQALNALLTEVQADPLAIVQSDAEDIHSWVEQKLIEKVGDLGKLHTGRSRNDQVATDLKLWCKQQVGDLHQAIGQLQQALVETAEANQDAVMPGYTHLQRAQPVTFAHWCLAYVEMLARDESRLQDTLKRLDVSPLGSGALAGTAYPIDREQLAGWLGFASATRNSLDSVSDRDHVLELLSNAAISMVHLSRFAEDLIFFNSGEAAFVELSDRVTSGSSLMPQKKNPDALELIRGKCGRVQGALTGMMMTLKACRWRTTKTCRKIKKGCSTRSTPDGLPADGGAGAGRHSGEAPALPGSGGAGLCQRHRTGGLPGRQGRAVPRGAPYRRRGGGRSDSPGQTAGSVAAGGLAAVQRDDRRRRLPDPGLAILPGQACGQRRRRAAAGGRGNRRSETAFGLTTTRAARCRP